MVAPGKQCVMALKNLMYLVIESPMISVVAGRRGHGGEERALKPPALGRSTCAETGADGPGGVRVLDGRGSPPERLETASFSSWRRRIPVEAGRASWSVLGIRVAATAQEEAVAEAEGAAFARTRSVGDG